MQSPGGTSVETVKLNKGGNFIGNLQSWMVAVFLIILQGVPAAAEEPQSPTPEKVINSRQQSEMNGLRERIKHLEDEQAIEDLQPQFGVNLGAYGDVNFATPNRDSLHSTFWLDSLDLYSTANYGPRLNFLAELQAEIEDSNEGNFDVERLWVGYTFNDLFIVRAGRQHTALGYWNNTYHHAKQHYLTVNRPFFLDFEDEGGVFPMHNVGMELTGSLNNSGSRWTYDLNVGNGHYIDPATGFLVPVQVANNYGTSLVALRISNRPAGDPGLTLGVFGSAERVAVQAGDLVDERLYGVDLSYVEGSTEVITEFFRPVNKEKSAYAYYAQIGYRVLPDLTPYARYEALFTNSNDPYFSELLNGVTRKQMIAGARYDLDVLRSALKLQYRHDAKEGSKIYNLVEAQWCFGF
jgi:hypothetical protein